MIVSKIHMCVPLTGMVSIECYAVTCGERAISCHCRI
jgi:hypothetical protein